MGSPIRSEGMTMEEKDFNSRKHDACKICGVDADCMYVDQETELCNACTTGVWI